MRNVQTMIDSMTLEKVPVSSLVPWEKNPRVHGDDIDTLCSSIGYFGWTNPILVQRGTNRIIAGHGRYQGALKKALEIVPVIFFDFNEQEAAAYTIADNATAERSEWDYTNLQEILADLKIEGFDLEFTGLEAAMLDELTFDTEKKQEKAEDRKGSLTDSFGAPPFSVLDARQGYWQDRKRQWLDLGITSEDGRDVETYAASAQPPAVYELRNEMRGRLGRDPNWDEIIAEAEKRGVALANGSSIFDPVLCEIAYTWFSPKNGRVLDPFAGGSVRGIVAQELGRSYVGIDLRPEQIEANEKQATVISPQNRPTWIVGDSRDVLTLADGQFDFVFSCPPYADLEVYSNDPKDLSNLEYQEFLAAYRDIIRDSIKLLKQDRFACFVVGEIRDSKGICRNFVSDTIAAFQDAGAMLYNECILTTMLSSAPVRAKKAFVNSRKLTKVHQNILVFCKGNPKLATEACGEVELMEFEEQHAG
jgi:hypothetical protein